MSNTWGIDFADGSCRARNIGRISTGYQNGVIGRAAERQWSENGQ
jgi:hypothetical protein